MRRVPRHLVLALLLLLAVDVAAAQPLLVQVGDKTRAVSSAELAALPQDTLVAQGHHGPAQTFVGPRVSDILALAGARLDSLRGRALARYLVVEARDGYRVVFSVAEVAEDLTGRRVLLALQADGKPMDDDFGPWRILAEGDTRPSRWVRQVATLRLLEARTEGGGGR